ncbi:MULTISPECIES: hypothetical protein [unclassified Streptomyces]|uniref:hypothetical protein n=1 Tax=unclassified Streptomyces TaxID=2593676 RepID=UPI0016618B9D|nr:MULTISPECIES: hypothetical protein [unclassified Streptomyces]MBD0840842.1 hypothetical protein [Streptomyces sp. TRM68416]
MRRTALAALCLAAAAATTVTACQSGEDKAQEKTNSSSPTDKAGPSAEKTEKTEKKEPFAGLTGGEIADRAAKATTEAASLRMKGEVPDEESGGMIQLDLALNKKGECAGHMSMDGEGRTDLIKTGDTLYMKYDEAFLRAQSEGEPKADVDATVDMLAGKWTKMSAKGPDAEGMTELCDLEAMLGDAADSNSDATRGKTTTVDGKPAITLHEKDGKDSYTLYVATEGEPYLLRLVSTTPSDSGALSFSEFDKPVPADAPTGEVLDLDEPGA